MGWVGPAERVREAIRAHADNDEQGNHLLRGGRIADFLGAGQEFCLDDNVEIRVDGEWKPLIPLVYGGIRCAVL